LFEGFDDDAATSIGASLCQRTAVVLYDLIPWIHQATYLTNDQHRYWYLDKIDHLRRADLLLGISASSTQEAVEHLGFDTADAVNISTAADNRFKLHQPTSEQLAHLSTSYRLHQPFVMYTGGIDHRKNIEGLLESWARLPGPLRQTYQLAIVCSIQPADRDRLSHLARRLDLEENAVVFTGYVPDSHLLWLYNACELFVFPSWHEGFGLPVLEAMQCGKAVLAANRTSLPEVVGRTDSLFDPFDTEDIAHHIERALTDETWRQELAHHGLQQAQQFSWEASARHAWQALEERLDPEPRIQLCTGTGQRPRLAFVSPFPPEQSGIADYSADLLRDLTRWYRIDVVAQDPNALSDDYIRAVCGVLSLDEFRCKANSYDRILYHFGNSPFHEHMFDLLKSYPGVVVLHDFFLSGVQSWSESYRYRPFAATIAIHNTHGYQALVKRFNGDNPAKVIDSYPGNLSVLQQALGLIVHSQHSVNLALTWYGQNSAIDWTVIPLLRVPVVDADRHTARKRLGLSSSALVICSFGILGPHKLNDRLLEAWLASSLAQDAHAHLVFVGEPLGHYGERIQSVIQASPQVTQIRITGWAEVDTYRDWLAASDIAVQLRSNSRGETSAGILDCLNYGIATIANAHGSMAEIDTDALWLLPDNFSTSDLTDALEILAGQPDKRIELGQNGQHLIRTLHNPRRCSEDYWNALEGYYRTAERSVWGATQALAEAPTALWPSLATCLARNHPPYPRQRQLLVDVSELVQRDAKSGIQRVTRAILSAWLRQPPAGFVIEPVYATADALGYRYARRWTTSFLHIADEWAEDEPVEVWPGDFFFSLDLLHHLVPLQQPVWQEWRRRGVKIGFILYDLLPLLLPNAFVNGAASMHARWLSTISTADSVIAISSAVADEYAAWLDAQNPSRALPLQIGWFHLGADTDNSKPTKGLPPDTPQLLAQLAARPSLLMVGTVEPRKGHAQTLSACDILWREGTDFNLVIVGKQGWQVDELANRLHQHPEHNHRLFWLQGISDEYLDRIYAAATGCLMASEGEGFGLPLIEAARHGLPLLARDLPVFREVAGDHATYFPDDLGPEPLATAIAAWLTALLDGKHTLSTGLPWLTWEQSATQLLDTILKGDRYLPWHSRRDGIWRFWGNDVRLQSECGQRRGQTMRTTGQAGLLLHGPGLTLSAGQYRATLTGNASHLTGSEWLQITYGDQQQHLPRATIQANSDNAIHLQLAFQLETQVEDLEIRLWVDQRTQITIQLVELKKD